MWQQQMPICHYDIIIQGKMLFVMKKKVLYFDKRTFRWEKTVVVCYFSVLGDINGKLMYDCTK